VDSSGSSYPSIAITPNLGDLLVYNYGGKRATTADSVLSLSDAGSAWTQHPDAVTDSGKSAACMWWKIATSADTGGITPAVSAGSGNAGEGTLSAQFGEVDIYRLPSGYQVIGIDLYGATNSSSNVTTLSFTSGVGSSYPNFTDALAVTFLYDASGNGGITGSNTFTGTSSAKNLALALTTDDAELACQYVGGVQGSSTAGSNTFKNTWTTAGSAVNKVLYAASFVYKKIGNPVSVTPSGLSVVTNSLRTVQGTVSV
jgi:hypothetical protein